MVAIPTKPTLKCNLGSYPVAVVATKAGRPVTGADVKFETWITVLGREIGPRIISKQTDVIGLAQACILYGLRGRVFIYHRNEDFGSGKGVRHIVGTFTSLKSPKFFIAKASTTVPTTPPIPTIEDIIGPLPFPLKPIEDVFKPPEIPTPTMPDVPIVKPDPKLPTGRIGAVTRLSVMKYFEDLPTVVGGTFWGCEGASKKRAGYAAGIVNVTATNRTIEKHSSIDVGETQKFRNGFSVKVVRVSLSGRSTYADVIIAPYKIVPPTALPITPPKTPTPPVTPPVTPPKTPTPTVTPPATPMPPVVSNKIHQRITRILSDSQDLPKAYKGENVKITAESYCVVNGKIDKSSVPSFLIVDGVVSGKKPVVGGLVSYEWTATSIPPRHTICVQINPTDTCKSIGKDCKKISVSSAELDIADQLLRERASSKEQRELIKLSRESMRQELISATRDLPTVLPVSTPTVAPTVAPKVIPSILPIKPVAPETGSIKLTGLPLSVPNDVPAYVYVDNINKGSVTNIPMTLTSIPVGSHSVYVMAGGFKSISKNVDVTANETTIVSLL